jgi:type I restriction enzyme S subunit
VNTRCIGDVAELLRGVTYGKSDTTDSTDPDALPLLRATNITELGLLLADLVFIPARLARPEQRVRKGDIVMTMSSGSASVVGRSALVDDPIDATFGAFCGVLRGSDQVLGQYLSYMICAPHVRQYWTDRARGTNINNLKREDVLQTEILVPPLAEQQRIVAKLDEVMALGDLLQDLSALERARSEELRQRMTVELMESSGPLVALGGLCEVLDSKRQPITKKDRAPGSIPYYGATGVVDYVRDFLFDEDLVLLGEDGAKWGPGDKSAFAISGRTWVNNHAHVLRPDREVVRDQWLIEYLNATDLTEYVTGLTVPKLNQAQMRSLPIPVPTLAVQDEVLARMDSVFELSGRLGEISAVREAKASELRQAVLAAAFRGDL